MYKIIGTGVGIVTGLWLIRCVVAGTAEFYWFLPLNALLAAVPLAIEPGFGLLRQRLHGQIATVCRSLLGFVWLMFIPNAFYLLTDFMHLNSGVLVNSPGDTYYQAASYARGDAQYVFDSLLIFAGVVFGAYVGALALLHAYAFLRRHLSVIVARVMLGSLMVLSGVGVYLGRFGRWNSWQAFYQPQTIMGDLLQQLMVPVLRERFMLTVMTMLIFQIVSIWVAKRLIMTSQRTHR